MRFNEATPTPFPPRPGADEAKFAICPDVWDRTRFETFKVKRANLFDIRSSSQNAVSRSGLRAVVNRNERVQLEMKIMKYRQLARQTTSDDLTRTRIEQLISELERKLREIDE